MSRTAEGPSPFIVEGVTPAPFSRRFAVLFVRHVQAPQQVVSVFDVDRLRAKKLLLITEEEREQAKAFFDREPDSRALGLWVSPRAPEMAGGV